MAFWTIRILVLIIISEIDPNIDTEEWVEPGWMYHILSIGDTLVAYIYYAWLVWLVWNVRSAVRSRYEVYERVEYCPPGCDDVACSLVCPCLVTAQLLRHTADYETTGSRLCTDTGLLPLAV